MSHILVTGASGFLGSAFIPKLLEKGQTVYGLSRHPPEARQNLIPLAGDITEQDLGLEDIPGRIDAVHHLAGIHHLGDDRDGSIWKTNVFGTENVINFCITRDIPRLYFTSTAYTQGRNTYEKSKARCEMLVYESDIPKVTIYKPSVIMGTAEHPYPGHFSQFVRIMVKLHRAAETARRTVEKTLALPIIEPVFRIQGNPEGYLNLVTVDDVAAGMIQITRPGTYFLTNPKPPSLEQLVTWVGEYIKLNFKILPEFKPTPLEKQFAKLASSFIPYLQGDVFDSHLKQCTAIDREFIHDTVSRAIGS